MKICFLAMSGIRVKSKELAELGVTLPGFVQRGKVIASLPSLGLLTLAALTPDEFELVYREITDISDKATMDDLADFDLVAISSLTASIYDAYEIADALRAKKIKVVIGGLHATLLPFEAKEHADSIVVGEGEAVWEDFLSDLKKRSLKPFYRSADKGGFNLAKSPAPRFDLLNMERYNRITIQTSRGCPHNCEFCASSRVIRQVYCRKPVEKIVMEIDTIRKHWKYPFIEFADDNTFVNKAWSRDFLEALIPRKVRWFTETDISVAEDEELLDMLFESGCRQLLIGLESVSEQSLAGIDSMNWKLKRRDRYIEAIELIQSRGIPVNGCFIIGLDGDTVETFEEIRNFIVDSKLLEAQITVLTPFPGTRLYERLKTEGRLLTEKFWDRCTLFDVNFRPNGMSVEDLENGLKWLFKEIYSNESLMKRRRHYVDILKKTGKNPLENLYNGGNDGRANS